MAAKILFTVAENNTICILNYTHSEVSVIPFLSKLNSFFFFNVHTSFDVRV